MSAAPATAMSSTRLSEPARLVIGVIAILIMGLGWSGSFTLSKIAREAGAPALGLIIWEGLGSGLLLLIACVAFKKLPRLKSSYLLYYLINGLLGLTIPGVMLFWSAPHIPVGVLTLLLALAPIMTYAYVLVLRTERFDPVRAFGVVLGFLGVGLIVLPESSLPDPDMIGWVLFGFLAASIYAAQNVYLAIKSPPDADSLSQTCGMLLLGGIAALPPATLFDGFLWIDFQPSIAVWCAVAMMLINAALMAVFVWVIRAIGPVFAAQTANFVTLGGIFWGWLVFSEVLSLWVWAAIISLMCGVALVTLRRSGAV